MRGVVTLGGVGEVDLTDVVPLDGIVGPRHVYRLVAGHTPVIVKALDHGSIAPAASALAWIGQHALEAATLLVPTVLLADDAERLLITTELPGRPLAEMLAGSSGQAVVGRVGRALAELHALAAGPLPATTMGEHISELIDPHPSMLASAAPQWSSTIHDALDVLGQPTPSAPVTIAPIHRDFHVRQIIVSDRIGVVDWDVAAAGDPLFDVAYFTTYLETHGLDADGGLRAAFLGAYASLAREPLDDHRLDLYRLFNLLRRACRRHRLRDGQGEHGWVAERDRMLAEVARSTGALA